MRHAQKETTSKGHCRSAAEASPTKDLYIMGGGLPQKVSLGLTPKVYIVGLTEGTLTNRFIQRATWMGFLSSDKIKREREVRNSLIAQGYFDYDYSHNTGYR